MAEEKKEIRFDVPETWHREIKAAAKAQGLSIAGLCRIIVRGFLRNRYRDDERALLEAKP